MYCWDDDIEDINLYKSKEDIQNQLGPNENGNDQTNNTNSIFSFGKEIKIGDIVIAKKGSTQVVGLGVITSNYIPPSSSNNPRINLDYCHVRRVKWIFDQNSISIEGGNFWIPTVSYLSDDDIRLKNILEQYNISISDIQKKVGNIMSEINNQEIINILKYKYQIILQGPPGTGKTRLAEEIAYQLIFGEAIDNSKREQALEKLSKSEQYKLLQFHPAYSYEDFVRGITAKANDEGYIEYIVENKILGDFAKKAQDNLTTSNKKTDELSEENWINESFESFRKDIIKDLAEFGRVALTKNIYLFEAQNDYFRYKGDNWIQKGSRINFKSFKDLIKENLLHHNKPEAFTVDVKNSHANYRYSYYFPLLELFFKKSGSYKPKQIKIEERKNFILIIDEINRANLPSVLGELIFALEYRGREIDTMYSLEDSNKIILPENLFIIGTMNTADRSVGHIDYALRRRFAFETIFPQKSVISTSEGQNLFMSVANLFCKNYDEEKKLKNERSIYLSTDFLFQDVMIGHSYFMGDIEKLKMKLEYEIKPILREYLKDGILLEDAKNEIENLYA